MHSVGEAGTDKDAAGAERAAWWRRAVRSAWFDKALVGVLLLGTAGGCTAVRTWREAERRADNQQVLRQACDGMLDRAGIASALPDGEEAHDERWSSTSSGAVLEGYGVVGAETYLSCELYLGTDSDAEGDPYVQVTVTRVAVPALPGVGVTSLVADDRKENAPQQGTASVRVRCAEPLPGHPGAVDTFEVSADVGSSADAARAAESRLAVDAANRVRRAVGCVAPRVEASRVRVVPVARVDEEVAEARRMAGRVRASCGWFAPGPLGLAPDPVLPGAPAVIEQDPPVDIRWEAAASGELTWGNGCVLAHVSLDTLGRREPDDEPEVTVGSWAGAAAQQARIEHGKELAELGDGRVVSPPEPPDDEPDPGRRDPSLTPLYVVWLETRCGGAPGLHRITVSGRHTKALPDLADAVTSQYLAHAGSWPRRADCGEVHPLGRGWQ